MRNRGAAVPAAAALLALLALALPATAAAVDPKRGHYAQKKKNVFVVNFDLRGGKIRSFSHDDSCSTFSVPVPPMTVGANGRFSFEGTGIKNGAYQEYTVRVTGEAVSQTVIKGSMTYQKTAGNGPDCKTTTKFRAKRTGPPRD